MLLEWFEILQVQKHWQTYCLMIFIATDFRIFFPCRVLNFILAVFQIRYPRIPDNQVFPSRQRSQINPSGIRWWKNSQWYRLLVRKPSSSQLASSWNNPTHQTGSAQGSLRGPFHLCPDLPSSHFGWYGLWSQQTPGHVEKGRRGLQTEELGLGLGRRWIPTRCWKCRGCRRFRLPCYGCGQFQEEGFRHTQKRVWWRTC